MQYVQNLVLNVSTEKKYQYVHAKQGDNESRYLRITLMGGGRQIIPESGTAAAFRCLKPDGRSCTYSGTINADGTITVELDDQSLACPGVTKADVCLMKGSSVLSSATFLIQVGETPTSSDNTPSENEFLLLAEKVAEAAQAIDNANAAADNANTAADRANTAANTIMVASINGEVGTVTLPIAGTGTCSTTASAANKQVVPVSSSFMPVEGAILAVDFVAQNTADNPLLTYHDATFPIVDTDKNRISAGKLTAGMHLFIRRGSTWVLIDGGNTVEVDTTLTLPGKAADAGAVGEALSRKLSLSGGTMTGPVGIENADLTLRGNNAWLTLLGPNGEGAYLFARDTNGDGNPVCGIYGTHGDESVTLRGISAPQEAEDAVNKAYADSLPGTGHDNTYTGVDLTVKFAAEIAASGGDEWAWVTGRKNAGNFSGIHVGDYIPVTANGHTYKAIIMGINTYNGYGDTEVGPHIDWIFDWVWITMKPTNPVAYNNGLIPVENVTSNGTSRQYTLTKQMNAVSSITMGGQALTGWTYDASTFKITFSPAPSAGTMVVTGTGTEYPWLACDAYHFINSLAGQVPNSTAQNPAVKHVDYTNDGVYYYLPQKLKNVIIQKRMYLPKRYSEDGILSKSNGAGWADIGNIWLPTEHEVYGYGVYGGQWDAISACVQYPYFAGNMNRIRLRWGKRANYRLLSPEDGTTSNWCSVDSNGNAKNHGASNGGTAFPICFRT